LVLLAAEVEVAAAEDVVMVSVELRGGCLVWTKNNVLSLLEMLTMLYVFPRGTKNRPPVDTTN
jgi:hypothetical protein